MKRLINASKSTIRFSLGSDNKKGIISLFPNGETNVEESDFNSMILHLISLKLLDCVDVIKPVTPVVVESEGIIKKDNEEFVPVVSKEKKKGKRN
jgi:hypothetical protein